MQNSHGKEIDLSRVTVKIPGVIFRQTGGQVSSTASTANGSVRNQSADANPGEYSLEAYVWLPKSLSYWLFTT